ncbi:MAG: hypothetical protein M3R68_04225 [Acidobacteriota bacterium]|nr:hypothetical protein [Acidobacteriota bacterium]
MTNGKCVYLYHRVSVFPCLRVVSSAFCLLLTAFCLLPSSAHGQEVVDKTVATVNGGVRTDLITYSDLLWQLALQPKTVLGSPSSDALNGALRLLEDQRLILQEAVKLPTIAPSEQEIATARDELAKQFTSRDELEQRMIRVGLTSEKLNEILEQRVQIEKYLDFRFRSFIVIAQKDVADYYRETWVPRFKVRSPRDIVPTLEQARPEIERTLTETKVESDIDSFLDNARDRAEIVILNPV